MSGCQCFQIGGPFIDFDPQCPAHGYEAQRERAEHEAEMESLRQAAFDPKKLRIELKLEKDWQKDGSNLIATLFYDNEKVSQDEIWLDHRTIDNSC